MFRLRSVRGGEREREGERKGEGGREEDGRRGWVGEREGESIILKWEC